MTKQEPPRHARAIVDRGEWREGGGASALPATSPDGWFAMRELLGDVIALTETLGEVDPRFGPIDTHAYLVRGAERAALVDTGLGIGDLVGSVTALWDGPVDVLLTHYHYDHVADAHRFERVAIGDEDADAIAAPMTPEMDAFFARIPARCRRPLPAGFRFSHYWMTPRKADRRLRDGELVDLGGRRLVTIHTPGHSPGSCCFLEPDTGLLFTGDTVYQGPLNIQLERSDLARFTASVERLERLSGSVRAVCPAHYATPLDAGILAEIQEAARDVQSGRASTVAVEPLVAAGDWRMADFARFTITVAAGALAGGGPGAS